jgi:hypothetical protein
MCVSEWVNKKLAIPIWSVVIVPFIFLVLSVVLSPWIATNLVYKKASIDFKGHLMAANNEPIPNTEVIINGKTAKTNSSGYFTISAIDVKAIRTIAKYMPESNFTDLSDKPMFDVQLIHKTHQYRVPIFYIDDYINDNAHIERPVLIDDKYKQK